MKISVLDKLSRRISFSLIRKFYYMRIFYLFLGYNFKSYESGQTRRVDKGMVG
jgi:hypothetical protein